MLPSQLKMDIKKPCFPGLVLQVKDTNKSHPAQGLLQEWPFSLTAHLIVTYVWTQIKTPKHLFVSS